MFVRSGEDSVSMKIVRKELNRVQRRYRQASRGKLSWLAPEQPTTSWQRQIQSQNMESEQLAPSSSGGDFENDIIDHCVNDALEVLVSELNPFCLAPQPLCEFSKTNYRERRNKVDSTRGSGLNEEANEKVIEDTHYRSSRRRCTRVRRHGGSDINSCQTPTHRCGTNMGRSNTTRSGKELADEYHTILDADFRGRVSPSIYSRESWEGGAAKSQRDVSIAGTVWSMLYS